MQQIVGTRNDIAKLDVDIIIDEQPDVVTLQAETFEMLAKAAQAGFPVPPEVLLEAMPLAGKTKRAMIEKMKKAAEAPPQPDPALQIEMLKAKQQAEAQQAKMQGDQVKLAAEMELKRLEIESQKQQMAWEREKAQQDMAFERMKMAFEIDKMRLQGELAREGAMFTRQKGEIDIQARREAASAAN